MQYPYSIKQHLVAYILLLSISVQGCKTPMPTASAIETDVTLLADISTSSTNTSDTEVIILPKVTNLAEACISDASSSPVQFKDYSSFESPMRSSDENSLTHQTSLVDNTVGQITNKDLLSKTFIAKDGYRVAFQQQAGQIIAHVQPSWSVTNSQVRYVPVHIEPVMRLSQLLHLDEVGQKHRIHVIFSKQDKQLPIAVYVGSMGLLGGGNSNSTPTHVTCNECGASAPVVDVKRERTGSFLWIKFHDVTRYYRCPYCLAAHERREREQREREEAQRRREEERQRKEAERRKEEARKREEERIRIDKEQEAAYAKRMAMYKKEEERIKVREQLMRDKIEKEERSRQEQQQIIKQQIELEKEQEAQWEREQLEAIRKKVAEDRLQELKQQELRKQELYKQLEEEKCRQQAACELAARKKEVEKQERAHALAKKMEEEQERKQAERKLLEEEMQRQAAHELAIQTEQKARQEVMRNLAEKIKREEEHIQQEDRAYQEEQAAKEEEERLELEALFKKVADQREEARKQKEQRQREEALKQQEEQQKEQARQQAEAERIKREEINSQKIEENIAEQVKIIIQELTDIHEQLRQQQEKGQDITELAKQVAEMEERKSALEALQELMPVQEVMTIEEIEASMFEDLEEEFARINF